MVVVCGRSAGRGGMGDRSRARLASVDEGDTGSAGRADAPGQRGALGQGQAEQHLGTVGGTMRGSPGETSLAANRARSKSRPVACTSCSCRGTLHYTRPGEEARRGGRTKEGRISGGSLTVRQNPAGSGSHQVNISRGSFAPRGIWQGPARTVRRGAKPGRYYHLAG